MFSSGEKGNCRVCGHPNDVHRKETCVVKNCRKKIKICSCPDHSEFGTSAHRVICSECPNHGRTTKYESYNNYAVIGRQGDHKFVVREERESSHERSSPPQAGPSSGGQGSQHVHMDHSGQQYQKTTGNRAKSFGHAKAGRESHTPGRSGHRSGR